MPQARGEVCQVCGENEIASGDFVCRFCFSLLPPKSKRNLRLAIGRVDETHHRERAVRWLKSKRAGESRTMSETSVSLAPQRSR
jgi:hypothetical protein